MVVALALLAVCLSIEICGGDFVQVDLDGQTLSTSADNSDLLHGSHVLQPVQTYSGRTIYKCSSQQLDAQQSKRVGSIRFGLMVLDNAYIHGDEKFKSKNFDGGDDRSSDSTTERLALHRSNLLTPQLRKTVPEWRSKGLLDFMDERIIFIQQIVPKHCLLMEELAGPGTFEVYGSLENLGVPAALDILVRTAKAEFVMFLERDFHLDMRSKQEVIATLQQASNMLVSGQATLVLLRNIYELRGWGGMSSVCTEDGYLHAAFTPNVDEHGVFSRENCIHSSLRRFHTAIAALDLCTEKALPIALKLGTVSVCGDSPRAFCYSSRIAHWTNNPSFSSRSFLEASLLPLLPDCLTEIAHSSCKYAGVEISMELQCSLRQMDYPVVQTEGIFRHLNPLRNPTIEPCLQGEAYWKPEEQACESWV